MKNMDLAVNRLEKAIENEERILLFGDYDVDGTTAVALMYGFLKNYCPSIDFYIPDRYAEGYGISFQGIDYAAENGQTLIIALDCGIKAIDKVNYAKEKGIDFIICDHHEPGKIKNKKIVHTLTKNFLVVVLVSNSYKDFYKKEMNQSKNFIRF
jgi:single-stranded-DNA-specific exonuclease